MTGTNGSGPANSFEQIESIFADLDAVKLRLDDREEVNEVQVLSHVPVRRPKSDEFVRVHPAPTMSLPAMIYEDSEKGEKYFVAPAVRHLFAGNVGKHVTLVTAITRQRVLLLWPVPLPDPDGRSFAWHETSRAAAEAAKREWIRMVANKPLQAYDISLAEGKLGEPEWPGENFNQILSIAFRGRIIDSAEHVLVKRLRGLV